MERKFNDIIEEKLKLLPSSPGVYKMYNAEGEIIYVGKAISLKNRVTQYFRKNSNHTAKVLAMVSHIADFETISVSNETEALSLECNLIKQFSPKYNILLKDDKNFPYIRIDFRQDFPRVEVVRRISNDGAKYLGPYLSALLLRESLEVIRKNYPVRHCKKDISRAMARRERPCLMYHVGKCNAPCSGKVSREEYHAMLKEIVSFLEGNTKALIRSLSEEMEHAAENLEFERAAVLRDRIDSLRKISDKQIAIGTDGTTADVFAVGKQDARVMVYALYIRDGKIIGNGHYRMDASQDTPEGDIISAFITQFYDDADDVPKEILLYNEAPDADVISGWLSEKYGKKIVVRKPVRGDKAKLCELCYKNCLERMEKDAILQKRIWELGEGALADLSVALGMDSIPERIECYDNSHIMGKDTVGSMVVFNNGQPKKSEYRKFRIKTETNGDDIAAMREVLTRRFTRALNGDASFSVLPDLLIVDGGITQLNVALEVLGELGFSETVPCISLAESDELIYVPGRGEPIRLEKTTAALHLIQRIRDEAHRFAVTFHRSRRDKTELYSVLDTISGIGEKRKRALYDRFVTLEDIKKASEEELCAAEGMNKPSAAAVFRAFHPDTGNEKEQPM